METQCDQCHREWEPYTEDGVTFCANCGVPVAKETEQ
jgi:predicted amidophosphoribosyltransferase